MDPRWLPWGWAAGALLCAAVFFTVQPWRREFGQGWRLVRKYPGAWLIPAGLAALDAAGRLVADFQGRTGAGGAASPAWGASAGPGTWGGSDGAMGMVEGVWPGLLTGLVRAVHGPGFGGAAALLGGALLAADVAGVRRGLCRGVVSVTGCPDKKAVRLVVLGILAGMGALSADALLAGRGLPEIWHRVLLLPAVPLTGWVAAAVLGGLLLLAETEVRAPERAEGVRWLESASAHAVRLWPWALAHGVVWWLLPVLPDLGGVILRLLVVLGGLGLVFAPVHFLHVRDLASARRAWGEAAEPWRTWAGAGMVAVWLAVAGLGFYWWERAGLAIMAGMEGAAGRVPDWARIVLAAAHGLVHIVLTVTSLAAWVSLRLAALPPPVSASASLSPSSRPARARRSRPG